MAISKDESEPELGPDLPIASNDEGIESDPTRS